MDIRVYLAGGKEKSSEKNTEKVQKRPNEEGKVPQSKRKFLPAWKTDFPWVYNRHGAMFCSVCEERPNLSDSSSAFVSGGCVNFRFSEKPRRIHWTPKSCRCHPNCSQPTRSSHPTGIETAEQRSSFKA